MSWNLRTVGFAAGLMLAGLSALAAENDRGTELGPADLVLWHGKVITVDDAFSEHEAIAVRGNRISALGSDAEIKNWIGGTTRVVDLRGRTVIPGFIEGHGHLDSLGRLRMSLDLGAAKSWPAIVELVKAKAAELPPGSWVEGRGWHQEHWTERPDGAVEGYPTHELLSRAVPEHPVILTHSTGHMSFANAKAMELAGIDRNTADPAGGTLVRDAGGEPTGVLRETAQRLVLAAYRRAIAKQSPAEREAEDVRALELAMQECLRKGVTTFCDAGSSFAEIDRIRQLADQGKLRIRLWVMVRDSNAALERHLRSYRTVGAAGGFLTVRAIKQMIDGALGSHGAWLLEPYDDLPESRGLNLESVDTIRKTALLAMEHDYALCVHAIGDRANREVLDIYREVFGSFPAKTDLRWRIEHAQHLHPDDIPRFAELGVIASMQANHATSDGPFVVQRLGVQRARSGAYAWRSLLDAGAVVINGTDTPVEDVDPLQSFRAAVTRRMADGRVFFGEQCMTRREALCSYTREAAFATFEEAEKGVLAPGKLADMVVLSGDLLQVPAEELATLRVDYTIIDGKIVYERTVE